MMPKDFSVIKDEVQYREYAAELARLAAFDPEPSSEEGKKLELLGLLVETYEKEHFPLPAPTPIDAILFRLEQKGWQQKDLVPILGSKSRVSEILSGRRRLTIPMIRRLSAHLDIPVSVLIGGNDAESEAAKSQPSLPLVREIVKRGWVQADKVSAKNASEVVSQLFQKLGVRESSPIYLRRSFHTGLVGPVDMEAIQLWVTRVLLRSRSNKEIRGRFRRDLFDQKAMAELARLSAFEEGPSLAMQFLAHHGISVVVEKQLPGTALDGAATIDTDGTPVIGLTLRYDRLDNFWFTLLHECAHLVLHIKSPGDTFVDDTETRADTDEAELEANRLTRDTLIPPGVWRKSDAGKLRTVDSVLALAAELRINPAIVAGRIRRETGNYKLFSGLVGHKKVKDALRID
jgi:HTH-type transcriptional regulator / antitoxin HigA